MERGIAYPALIDGEPGAYGVSFPDLPGVVAMGDAPDEAVRNAANALRDYAAESAADGLPPTAPSAPDAVDVPDGCELASIELESATAQPAR